MKDDSANTIPIVTLGTKDQFWYSRLGVWHVVCEDLANAVIQALEVDQDIGSAVEHGILRGSVASRGGRRNINLMGLSVAPRRPPMEAGRTTSTSTPGSSECSQDVEKVVQNLRQATADASTQISVHMEQWLELDDQELQLAHRQGTRSVIRLLEYQPNSEVPSHVDTSGFTLVFTTGVLEVQDPDEKTTWHRLEPHHENGCFLFLGSHLEERISERLDELTSFSSTSSNIGKSPVVVAPIHRVRPADIRKALTIHIKADYTWPLLTVDKNGSAPNGKPPVPSASELFHRQLTWDSEQYAKLLLAKDIIPSTHDIQDHWRLLRVIVDGDANSNHSFRLPDVADRGYWLLQILRYYAFLELHRRHPKEAQGMLPPRVIHHVWLSHQLQPGAYKADCQQVLGGNVLEHDNGSFHLDGCATFHRLWRQAYGTEWPSPEIIQHEVENSATVLPPPHMIICLQANLTVGLDSLVNLYDGVQTDVPDFLQQLLQPQAMESVAQAARQNYARFLLAASYASTKGIGITPGALNDLIWHTHQTDPLGYGIAMEHLPCFVDHHPCGKLRPPPINCKWLQMTKQVWLELYGVGVDVPGHGLYCCSHEAELEVAPPRPEGLYTQSNAAHEIYNMWLSCAIYHFDADVFVIKVDCSELHSLGARNSEGAILEKMFCAGAWAREQARLHEDVAQAISPCLANMLTDQGRQAPMRPLSTKSRLMVRQGFLTLRRELVELDEEFAKLDRKGDLVANSGFPEDVRFALKLGCFRCFLYWWWWLSERENAQAKLRQVPATIRIISVLNSRYNLRVAEHEMQQRYEDIVARHSRKFEYLYGVSISLIWKCKGTPDYTKRQEINRHYIGPSLIFRRVQGPQLDPPYATTISNLSPRPCWVKVNSVPSAFYAGKCG